MVNKIAERLKTLIKEEKINNAILAKAINANKSIVTFWLQGKTAPTADYIIKLCDYFNVCADYLLGRQDWY